MSGGMSLVSSYTAHHGDSDEELEPQESLSGNISDEDEHRSPAAAPRKRPAEENYSPVIKDSDSSDRQQQKMSSRLVSYGDADDDDEDDEEDESDDEDAEQGVEMKTESLKVPDAETLVPHDAAFSSELASSLSRSVQNVAADDIDLPPESKGRCSKHLQDKISKMYQKVKYEGIDMNKNIQQKKEFRNPSIYEKLIDYINIDEKGTNYPPEIYNPKLWGKESYYDELARVQKVEMDKREKERKDRTKVEFVTGTKATVVPVGDADKRKSKWDISMASAAAASSAASAASVPPSATSGAKSTVIPATGSLTKKKV